MTASFRRQLTYETQPGGASVSNYFNAASIGLESKEAREAAESGPPDWNQALDSVQYGCATLLGVPQNHVSIYHNTTAAIQRVFVRVGHVLARETATLFTTDVEYPGIIALADENWHGRIVMAEIGDLIWRNRFKHIEESIRRAFLVAKPDVVYLSHITRASGYRFPLETLLPYMKQINPRIVIIIDGAQAVGNIVVGPDILELVDFYVTSGHKWLSGRTTLGILYAPPMWRVSDPAQSYSRLSGSGGTGNLQALWSLNKALEEFIRTEPGMESGARMKMIADYNASLARQFVQKCRQRKLHLPLFVQDEQWRHSGIVPLINYPRAFAEALERDGKCAISWLRDEPWTTVEGGDAPGPRFLLRVHNGSQVVIRRTRFRDEFIGPPVPPNGVLRVCFHLYHGATDVAALADQIALALAEVERKANPSRTSEDRGVVRKSRKRNHE